MQIFYAETITGEEYVLDQKESRHCVRVLRMTKGATVNLIDGKGNLYEGSLTDADPNGCRIRITNVTSDFEKRPYHLHIALSPLKNSDRFEWFIEKCVEIGIDEITPIICRNTERMKVKAERINNIIVSAMKQSLKAFRPVLNEPSDFTGFVSGTVRGTRMIAHCNNNFERQLISSVYTAGSDAVIMIGPEGDFSPDEIRTANDSGFRSVQLGSSRLRSETAGLVACHSIYFLNH